MVRKLKSFQVLISESRQIFYSGENISGLVIIDILDSIKCKNIKVEIEGQSYCHWTTTRTTQPTQILIPTGRQNLINLQAILFGASSHGSERHPAGRQEYPCSFTLPSPGPSSFEWGTGHIGYYLEAKVDRPWKFDHKSEGLLPLMKLFITTSLSTWCHWVIQSKTRLDAFAVLQVIWIFKQVLIDWDTVQVNRY